MRARVGTDLPTLVDELLNLVPGQWGELLLERASDPFIHSGPRQRTLSAGEVGRYKQRAYQAQPREDRRRKPQHRAERVVERHGEELGSRSRGNGLGERGCA